MNKTELIEYIADRADVSKVTASRTLAAAMEAIESTLRAGGRVSLVGFGTFSVSSRAARMGRNPRTNRPIKIEAARVPRFRPGKALKDSLNRR